MACCTKKTQFCGQGNQWRVFGREVTRLYFGELTGSGLKGENLDQGCRETLVIT